MNFLKGLTLSLLGLLLFLSLSVFGIAFTLNSTLLNPDFVVSEVDKIEVAPLVRGIVGEQIVGQLPPEAEFMEDAIYGIIAAQEPWLKEQLNAAIYSFYDFMLGKSERLSLIISLEPLKEGLRDSLLQTFMQSMPPQLSGLPPAQIEQYFDQIYQEFAGQIPSEIGFDESFIPPEAMEQIIRVRQGIGYYQTGYNVLIGLMVLLVLGIILIKRDVRNITRGLGITFLTYGAIEYAGVMVAKNLVPQQLPLHQLPSSLQPWLVGLFGDLLAPLEMFSLGLLIGGVVLLVVSFVYKPRLAE